MGICTLILLRNHPNVTLKKIFLQIEGLKLCLHSHAGEKLITCHTGGAIFTCKSTLTIYVCMCLCLHACVYACNHKFFRCDSVHSSHCGHLQ